jgi:hypothetical protein
MSILGVNSDMWMNMTVVLPETINREAGESQKPKPFFQSHNKKGHLRMRWILADGSLVATWKLHKPSVSESLTNSLTIV